MVKYKLSLTLFSASALIITSLTACGSPNSTSAAGNNPAASSAPKQVVLSSDLKGSIDAYCNQLNKHIDAYQQDVANFAQMLQQPGVSPVDVLDQVSKLTNIGDSYFSYYDQSTDMPSGIPSGMKSDLRTGSQDYMLAITAYEGALKDVQKYLDDSKPSHLEDMKNSMAVAVDSVNKGKSLVNKVDKQVLTSGLTSKVDLPTLKPNVLVVAKSGGLGDAYSQVSKAFGSPTRVDQAIKDGVGNYGYKNDLYLVMYTDGRASNITVQLDSQQKSMSLTDAVKYAQGLLPSDATFVKKYNGDANDQVYVYHSKALESLFTAENFQNSNGTVEPGDCSVDFVHNGNTVDSLVVALGSGQ